MPLDHFDIIAPVYARVSYSAQDKMRELAGLPVNGRLLDIGGGTGRVASALLKDVDEVVIADVSMGMLRQTPRSTLKPVCSHSENLPFPDDFFERVIMVDALHHVIDQPASAREMLRVLKPGGRIIIEEPDINTFAVKLIALAEKLLLMRSHFLSPIQITSLFPDGSAKIVLEDSNAWVVISK
jgi:ubiquinone/menaquinone biosynthesis C-methylase UbiE